MISYRSALILGGARSGKSRFAQATVEAASKQRVFIATAQAFDDEMQERISRHQADRDAHWKTRLSNLLLARKDPDHETDGLIEAIAFATGPLVLVSNEVGQGIVPATPLGRLFRDAQGRLNQRVAQAVQAVVFVTAGCPTLLKPAPSFDLKLA